MWVLLGNARLGLKAAEAGRRREGGPQQGAQHGQPQAPRGQPLGG